MLRCMQPLRTQRAQMGAGDTRGPQHPPSAMRATRDPSPTCADPSLSNFPPFLPGSCFGLVQIHFRPLSRGGLRRGPRPAAVSRPRRRAPRSPRRGHRGCPRRCWYARQPPTQAAPHGLDRLWQAQQGLRWIECDIENASTHAGNKHPIIKDQDLFTLHRSTLLCTSSQATRFNAL